MNNDITISSPDFPRISYSKQGNGEVLMLLHGFPENHELWKPVLPTLSQKYTVISPDLPGSGNSTLDQENITIEEMAEAVIAIVKAEKIEKMVLAGHSMGGYISLAFAEKYPSYLKGLSLIHSTATSDDEEKKTKRQKSVALIRKGGKEAFIREMVPNLFAERFRKENKAIIATQTERGMMLSENSMIAFYNAMMNRTDRTAILRNANYPIQMIIGKEEKLAPMDVLIGQAAMADISFISVFEDSLHMSMIEQPDRLASDLINFTDYCFSR
ncbi:MAG TPA: alpha/beta hydrolase [Flavipsychrobacter sp.]|nr:alpha/beta hydrolase [Flavipsychrobacter sp.]